MALALRPGSGLTFPWEEHIDRGVGYTQQYVFADGQSQASFVIDCPWDAFTSNDAINQILGTTRLDRTVSPPRIRRTVPMVHPIFPYLRATKIAGVQGIRTREKEALFESAKYERARITIVFSQLTYRAVDDVTLSTNFGNLEYERYLTRRVEPTAEFLTRGIGAWKWAQGTTATQDVVFGIPEFIGKERLNFIWHKVPAAGLFGTTLTGRAAKQEDGIGRVNSVAFLGHPIATLLLAGVGYRESLVPQPAADLAMGAPLYDPSLAYDVMFSMIRWDPASVVDNTAAGGAARGHNVFPPPKLGPWALVTDDGTTTGNRVYTSYSFADLFVLQ